MRKLIYILILGTTILLTSCKETNPNESIEEGKVEGKVYTSQEIGWTITIPNGWTVIDEETTEAINERGLKALEETMGQEIDDSKLKNLISFQKNQFNNFQSTSEPFELEYEGEWEENNAIIKQILFSTYENQGIEADSTETKIERINGLDFYTYKMTIYGPEGDVILNQILYSRLINGFDFSAVINYNNDQDKNELLKAFRTSEFVK